MTLARAVRARALQENLTEQRQRLERAAASAGREPAEIRLLAVSKTYPVEDIVLAYEAGQRDFGENYVQELAEKAEALKHLQDLRFHLIGHLQTNKAKYVVPFIHSIQTVSSERLALELEKCALKRRASGAPPIDVCIEVNIGGEAQKSGCAPSEVAQLLTTLDGLETLRPVGLMTVPPATPRPEDALPYFQALRALRDSLGGAARLPELSMGMSADAESAVLAGATWVRIGTAIFGARAQKTNPS